MNELPKIEGLYKEKDLFNNPDWNTRKGNTPTQFKIEEYKQYIDNILRTEKSWRARLKYLNKQIRLYNKINKSQ